MEIKATLKYLRMSPRKVRIVASLIKGMRVQKAENQLRFILKRAAHPLYKLLKSAVANAENNFNLEKKNLYVSEIKVDGASMLKRFRPRAFGRASAIRKRMSHVSMVLGVKEGIKEDNVYLPKRESSGRTKEKEVEKNAIVPERTEAEKSFVKKDKKFTREGVSKTTKKSADFVRRIFNRKAI